MITARHDPALRFRVVQRQALRYDAETSSQVGAGWVRAGSALARFGKRLVAVQDDALWLGWWEEPGKLYAQALPTDGAGPRLFDDKLRKPDFEAAVVLGECLFVLGECLFVLGECLFVLGECLFVLGECLFVLGSGSLGSRERIAVIDAHGDARLVAAAGLYGALRGESKLAGRQLNIEGALLDGGHLVLYSRGNAAAFDGQDGFDASVELDAAEFERYLEGTGAVPALGPVQQYRLGAIQSVRLTLTDVAVRDGKRYYVAAAEASPDAIADGRVLGTSLGVLDDDPRYGLIEAEDGTRLCDKVEGLLPGAKDDEWLAITDPDDARRPAELLTLRRVFDK